jgi:hypothetical protein
MTGYKPGGANQEGRASPQNKALPNEQDAEDIVKGANQTDQLEQMQENAAKEKNNINPETESQ